MLLRNVGIFPKYMTVHLRRPYSSFAVPASSFSNLRFLISGLAYSWTMKMQVVTPKRRYFSEIHDVKPQKTVFVIRSSCIFFFQLKVLDFWFGLFLDPKDAGDVTPKRRYFSEIHDVTPLKTVFLIRSSCISFSNLRFSRITEENLYL
jgi:hypothetical protein